jgi:type I restriction enzyme S subunit
VTSAAIIPHHWQRGNIRRFAQMKSGHTPSRSVPAYWDATDIPWFTLADVWQLRDGKQTYLGDTTNKINEMGLANSAAELLPVGTVVLSRTASVGFSGIMSRPMATSQDYWNWVCGPELLPEYLNYQFKSMRADLKSLNMGSTHQTIYQKDAATLQIVVPPLEEQRVIVGYLDRETARIDTLIEEQQRLIETLRERRNAVLAHTLLGSGPVVPFVRCTTEQTDYRGATPTKTDSGVQLITARNVKAGWIDYESSQEFVDPEEYDEIMRRGRPQIGDLLFTMEAPLGNVAVVDRVDIALAQRIIKWSVDRSKAEPRYLMYAVLSDEFQGQLRARATGSTALGIKASKLPELRIGLPSLEEQRRIVDQLNEQTTRIDTLIAETERFIELARERQSALITAAVTGQIDVREMV